MTNSHNTQRPLLRIVPTIILGLLLSLLTLSCQRDDPFIEKSTLNNKLFVVGSQIDDSGDLILYVNGSDNEGNPLTTADLLNANITVDDGVESTTYSNDGTNLIVQPVEDGDKILSLAFITDYSGSMSDAELDTINNVYRLILENLPLVYELQIINFSDLVHLRLDWTEAYPNNMLTILNALARDDSFHRNGTALYDAVGFALERDLEVVGSATTAGDGLIERCRPAHMMVVFTDGLENWSTTYTDRSVLLSMMNYSETVAIMLGTESADQAELELFAGDRGAVVSMNNTGRIASEIANWAISLQHIIKFRLSTSTAYTNKNVTITVGDQSVTIERPTDALCEISR